MFTIGLCAFGVGCSPAPAPTAMTSTSPAILRRDLPRTAYGRERQVTHAACGHVLTNVNCFSPDGRRIVYDVRSDAEGAVFDGDRIEAVDVNSGEVSVLYHSTNGARVGVASYSPADDRVIFIHGPEDPTDDWQYAACHRRGVVVGADGRAATLDARDLVPPFTPGALRGGSHVHVFDSQGQWVSFTYEDAFLAEVAAEPHEANQRNIGVTVPAPPVAVPPTHPRNHDGTGFTVLVTRTTDRPTPGSDDIAKAFEESWVGTGGYDRPDGTHQRHALAFQGNVVTAGGETISEVFVVDLPDDLTKAAPGEPLAGTTRARPNPPAGCAQRRLTFTADRKHPGLQGPRHWMRSSPDGARIALLMRDDAGTVQVWTVSPNGGEPQQLTHLPFDVASAFTWSPDGRHLTFAADNSVFLIDAGDGGATRVTPRSGDAERPLPLAAVFSPDGRRVAYERRVPHADGGVFNQVFVVDLPGELFAPQRAATP